MRIRSFFVAPAVVALALGVAACGGDDDDAGDTGGGVEVTVTGTDDACTPSSTQLAAGKTTFVFTNKAKDVSEIYVLSDGDKVVKEVEDVISGATRKLTVTLEAGKTYKLNCKPGQKGTGIVTPITVA